MKKIFIAYGDNNCAYSLKRIGRQAAALHLFDEIQLYTPADLPNYLKESPLMQHKFGGGFWAWKPCIIKETLMSHEEGDIVCYVDAGCSLRNNGEWPLYMELLKDYNTICFKYHGEMDEWKDLGETSTIIKHWAKKKSLLFFDDYVGSSQWRETNKVLGGFILCKGKENPVINEWLRLTIERPDLIIDPSEEEMKDQYPFFTLHRHDQVLLTAITYKFKDECLVLPETLETGGNNVAVKATRIKARNFKKFLEYKYKHWPLRIAIDSYIKKLSGKK